ncbi:50S ribosome-binding GTPase [Candidatus Woesearchaeota archaeon]|nr:50S ribosome-binding GTPase [Candidatus Woesearchaeota archaeon]
MKNQNIAFMLKRKELKHVSSEDERIRVLEELVSLNPKDPLDLALRTKYKKELEVLKKKSSSKGRQISQNPYDGIRYDRQVVLVGEANSGKSTLHQRLTGSDSRIAETPFTTYKPEMGIFTYNDVPVQIVEVPPVYQGENDNNKINFIRNSDVICITAKDFDRATSVGSVLEDYLIILSKEAKDHKHRRKDEIIEKPTLIAGWSRFDYKGCNVVDISSNDQIGEEIYRLLNIKRFYCFIDGRIEGKPLVFPKGLEVTVRDFADRLGLNRVREAKIFGSSDVYEGQSVGLDYLLNDGDKVNLK